MLAVRRIEHPHTGLAIRQVFDKILVEWEIPTNKVRAVMTDNSSNIVRAFKEHVHVAQSSSDSKLEEGSEGEGEAHKEGMMADQLDVEGIVADVGREDDFDKEERSVMECFGSLVRLSCFPHTLQLVVNKFNKDESVKPVLKKAYVLVKRVNTSTMAAQLLMQWCRKKLVSHYIPLGGLQHSS